MIPISCEYAFLGRRKSNVSQDILYGKAIPFLITSLSMSGDVRQSVPPPITKTSVLTTQHLPYGAVSRSCLTKPSLRAVLGFRVSALENRHLSLTTVSHQLFKFTYVGINSLKVQSKK